MNQMTEFIWVVMAGTGEYSNRRCWPLQAFGSEADARSLVAKLDAEAQAKGNWNNGERENLRGEWASWNYPTDRLGTLRRPDFLFGKQAFSVDYTGIDFSVMRVPAGMVAL